MKDDLFVEEEGVDYSQDFLTEMEEELFIEAESTRIVYVEKEPLFKESTNPNHNIFVVPTQEGADKEDQWNGSIGDAVMQHAMDMSHRLPEIEHFIHTSNGNIFRVEQNVAPPDEDGAKRISREILQVMTCEGDTKDKQALIDFMRSEIQENRKRIEERDDVMEQERVPYHDWERRPQMSREWDVPPTPKPLFVYAGTSRQMFYDFFPENHPDADLLNAFLMQFNSIDHDDFTEKVAEFFILRVTEEDWTVPTVRDHLKQFIEEVSREENFRDPMEAMQDALLKIEEDWNKQHDKKVMHRFKDSAPIKEMVRFYKHNMVRHKQGELMWGKVGKLGRTFFRFGTTMTSSHWSAYFRLKKKFAPRVMVGNLDINRASLWDLTKYFVKKHELEEARQIAKKIFFNRPFMTLEDVASKGIISTRDIIGTDKSATVVALIKQAGRKSIRGNTMAHISAVAPKIIEIQQANPSLLSEEEWMGVWQTYRICKEETKRELGLFS